MFLKFREWEGSRSWGKERGFLNYFLGILRFWEKEGSRSWVIFQGTWNLERSRDNKFIHDYNQKYFNCLRFFYMIYFINCVWKSLWKKIIFIKKEYSI